MPDYVNLTEGPDDYTLVAREDTILSGLGGEDHITAYGYSAQETGLGSYVRVIVYGGSGNDVLVARYQSQFNLSGDDGDDIITVSEGQASGGNGNDTLLSDGWAILSGGPGDDHLLTGGDAFGDAGDDFVTGGYYVSGGAGNDHLSTSFEAGEEAYLLGGAGTDILVGGASNDHLSGGAGRDYLTGGAGVDVFEFARLESRTGGGARDVVTDFEHGADKIDLAALGPSGFSELTFKAVGSGLIVYADLDHNGLDGADFGLQLTGVKTVSADDFIFA